MTRGDYSEHLRAILCYDSMVHILCIADRYWLHREIILNHGRVTEPATVNNTQGYILNLSKHIIEKQWTRPKLKYSEYRTLQVCDELGFWKPFNPNEYV